MTIQEITSFDSQILESINQFISQLTGESSLVSSHQIEEIIADNNSHLFFAINDQGAHMGMISVGLYITPTGKKPWIEDVVVDNSYRGQGIGKQLMEFAIQFTKEQKAATLMLTSNPARLSANELYKKIGFKQKETNVYRIQFD